MASKHSNQNSGGYSRRHSEENDYSGSAERNYDSGREENYRSRYTEDYDDYTDDDADDDAESYLDLDLDRYARSYDGSRTERTGRRRTGDRADHNSRQKTVRSRSARERDRENDLRQDSSRRKTRSAGKRRKKRKAVTILTFVMALVIAGGLMAAVYLQGLLGKINHVSASMNSAGAVETFDADGDKSNDTLRASDIDWGDTANIDVMEDNDIKNILLIGQDARSGESGQRSDSMILCSINTKEKKIKLVTLMRDMYVQIPGYQANKLNAAYALGGMELLDTTIEQNFGVNIDGNVEVDFDGFLEALTEVGDLDIELTYDEATYMNANEGLGSADDNAEVNEAWGLKEGVNTLKPEQVLCYARMRYVGNSDWDRTERQKKVIMAAYKKVQDLSATKLLSLASKIFPCITTDLSNSELLSYVKTLSVNHITTIETYRLPVDGTFTEGQIEGMSVLVPNLYLNSAYLQNYLYGKALPDDLDEKLEEVASSSDYSETDTYSDGSSYSSDSGYASGSDGTGGYTDSADNGGDYSGSTYNGADSTYGGTSNGNTAYGDNTYSTYNPDASGQGGSDTGYGNYDGTGTGYSDASYYGNAAAG
ncbi:MAG: LCP family protein [Bilifractor sp.]|jgi:LCP family protein required for cell wall assembly